MFGHSSETWQETPLLREEKTLTPAMRFEIEEEEDTLQIVILQNQNVVVWYLFGLRGCFVSLMGWALCIIYRTIYIQ